MELTPNKKNYNVFISVEGELLDCLTAERKKEIRSMGGQVHFILKEWMEAKSVHASGRDLPKKGGK